MSENATLELTDELTDLSNSDSKPQEQLLKSFNVLKLKNSQSLLKELTKCANGEIPEQYITSTDDGQMFKGQYQEHSSSREVKEDLSVSVGVEGKYGAFSGSVQTDYSKMETSAMTSFFSSYTAKLDIGTVSYHATSAITLSLLNPDMVAELNAIDNMAKAKKFTDAWGTHLVTRVSLGGMLFVSVFCETSTKTEKEKLAVTVKAKYSGVGSLSAVASVISEMARSESTKDVSQSVLALGGSATKAAIIDPTNTATFEKWIETCTKDTTFAVANSIEIFSLVQGDAHKFLKKYIDLSMLAHSLEHPTIFLEQKSIKAYHTNSVTAPGKHSAGYKIIGGGAASSDGSSSYLIGSYPQVGSNGEIPNGWNAISHDIANPADPRDIISAYAIGVYDPDNYLEIKLVTGSGTNPGMGIDLAEAALPEGWVLTGGGVDCGSGNGASKFVLSSYFKDASTWVAESTDYKVAAQHRDLKAYAIGIKSNDPLFQIRAVRIKGAEAYGQHGRGEASAQTCICGGGVRVWGTGGHGNLVQITCPSSRTSWKEANNDLDGSISPANYQAFAIALHANVVA